MEFKQDMNRFINSVTTRINKELTGDMYEKEKKTIMDRYKRAKENRAVCSNYKIIGICISSSIYYNFRSSKSHNWEFNRIYDNSII